MSSNLIWKVAMSFADDFEKREELKKEEKWLLQLNNIKYKGTIFFNVLYLFLERGKGRRKGERNINVWLPLMHPPPGDLALNPGMCSDWELSW